LHASPHGAHSTRPSLPCAHLPPPARSYFNDLSNAAKGISSVTPPTAAQLAGAWAALTPKATASYSELTAACEVAGISKATVSGVFQASCVATSGPIDVAQALLLLLTLGRASFQAVVQGIFEVGPARQSCLTWGR
jgi:hypothetical protein